MRISKEFTKQIHFYVSESQLDALREEATNQRVGMSSLIRDCIDKHLDPELRLKSIIDNRTTPIIRLHGEVLPHCDEMEMQEYSELSLECEDNEAAQIEWLLAKKAQREAPKVVVTEPELVIARVIPGPERLPIDELLKEFKDRN